MPNKKNPRKIQASSWKTQGISLESSRLAPLNYSLDPKSWHQLLTWPQRKVEVPTTCSLLPTESYLIACYLVTITCYLLLEIARKCSWRFPGSFQEMYGKCPGNVREISRTVPRTVLEIARKCPGKFMEKSKKLRGKVKEMSRKSSV